MTSEDKLYKQFKQIVARQTRDYINEQSVEVRKKLTENSKIMLILQILSLETQCISCYAVMKTSVNPVSCILCTSDTVSPYYC